MFHVAKVESVTCATSSRYYQMICSSDEEENENDWKWEWMCFFLALTLTYTWAKTMVVKYLVLNLKKLPWHKLLASTFSLSVKTDIVFFTEEESGHTPGKSTWITGHLIQMCSKKENFSIMKPHAYSTEWGNLLSQCVDVRGQSFHIHYQKSQQRKKSKTLPFQLLPFI